jgi:hypothetical protein
MEPSAVQKHHCEEGHKIRCGQIALPGCKGFRVARWNQRKLTQEQLKLVRAQTVLEQKHQAIGGDQNPGDHRRVTGRNSIPDRDHRHIFGSTSRNPGQYLALSASLWRVIQTFAAEEPKPALTSVNFREMRNRTHGARWKFVRQRRASPTFRGFCSSRAVSIQT